jgi:dCMP deaminase
MNKEGAIAAGMSLLESRLRGHWTPGEQQVVLDVLGRAWTEGFVYNSPTMAERAAMPSPEIPDIDTWGLAIAAAVSSKGECSRRQVGSVIVTMDSRIISAGWNRSAFPEMTCLNGDCPRALSDVPSNITSYDQGPGTCIAIHAEAAAILAADKFSLQNSTLYNTCEPCYNCKKLISAAGIRRIIWPGMERDANSNS